MDYTNREIDLLFQGITRRLEELKNLPFEKDVRESLTRVETDLGMIKIHIEERLAEERRASDSKYAPIILWTGFLGLLTLFAALIIPKLIALYLP